MNLICQFYVLVTFNLQTCIDIQGAVKFLVQPTYLNLIKHFFFGKGFLLRLKTFQHPFIYACSLCTYFNSLSLMKLLLFLLRSLLSLVYHFLSSPYILFPFFYYPTTTLLLLYFLSLSPKSFHKPSHPFAPPTICQDIVRHRSLSVCVWLSKYVYSWVEVGDTGFAGWQWEGEVPFL